MKVLVITSYSAAAEPRAVRNAIAARRAFPHDEIIFLDRVARGNSIDDPAALKDNGIKRESLPLSTKRSGLLQRAINLGRTNCATWNFEARGSVREALFGPSAIGLTRAVKRHTPDLVIAHTAQALPAALQYCREHDATLIFDVFEYYSGMGESQTQVEIRATKNLEREAYQHTALLLATSEELSKVLSQEFGATNVIVSLNVPPLVPLSRAPTARGGLRLYWRNSTVALGQRGLGDALEAMSRIPDDVDLFVQGRPSRDIAQIKAIACNLGVADRVHILPPFSVGNAVEAASHYDVGLCLERPGTPNHELTISNKFFDYHMAGLAVISADMPSLAAALECSGGGVTYRAGSAQSLAEAIMLLRNDRERLRQLRRSARHFAVERGNLEFELRQLATHFQMAVETNSFSKAEQRPKKKDHQTRASA